jgi:hypothetical protein
MEEQTKIADRKIVKTTVVVVEYDFANALSRRWAKRMNRKLTSKEFELENFEPGKVTYEKRKIINGG